MALDFSPGSDTEDSPQAMRRRLLEFARRAEAVDYAADRKLQGAVREIKALLKDGFIRSYFAASSIPRSTSRIICAKCSGLRP